MGIDRKVRRAAAKTRRRRCNVRLDGTPYVFRFKTIGAIDVPPPPPSARLADLRAVFYPKEVYDLLAKDRPGDPLWRQLARMSPEQAREEQRAEYELLLAGGITVEEVDQRMAAWQRAADARGVPFVDHIGRQHDLDRYLVTPDNVIVDMLALDGDGAPLDERDAECVRLRAEFGIRTPRAR